MIGLSKRFKTSISIRQSAWSKAFVKNHILRKVKRNIDFDFIYNEVKDTYGINGNESVAPPIILKMLLLLTHPWEFSRSSLFIRSMSNCLPISPLPVISTFWKICGQFLTTNISPRIFISLRPLIHKTPRASCFLSNRTSKCRKFCRKSSDRGAIYLYCNRVIPFIKQ